MLWKGGGCWMCALEPGTGCSCKKAATHFQSLYTSLLHATITALPIGLHKYRRVQLTTIHRPCQVQCIRLPGFRMLFRAP